MDVTVKTRFIPATDTDGEEIEVTLCTPSGSRVTRHPYCYRHDAEVSHKAAVEDALRDLGTRDVHIRSVQTLARGYVWAVTWVVGSTGSLEPRP